MKYIIFSLSVGATLYSGLAHSEEWSPQPRFSIDGSSYIETITFISGVSYGLTASKKELKIAGLDNFFCYPDAGDIDSKLLLDLLNEKLSGDNSSEAVVRTIMNQLKEKYPCGK